MAAAFGKGRISLAKRLVVLIVLVSTAFATLATIAQLYLEYTRDVEGVQSQLARIEGSYLGSIVENTWLLDEDRLQTLVEGVVQLPDVAYAAVSDDRGRLLAVAGAPPAHGTEETYELAHPLRDMPLHIGTFTVGATYSGVWARLLERAWFTLATNAAKTALVALIITFMVHRMLTRHLVAIAAFARTMGPQALDTPLTLEREQPPGQEDELDDLVAAFNQMRVELAASESALRASMGRYRALFTHSPVALAEQDFSGVHRRLAEMREQVGTVDFGDWLMSRPQELDACLSEVRWIAVNDGMRRLQDLSVEGAPASGIDLGGTTSQRALFRDLLVAFWNGRDSLSGEADMTTAEGETRRLIVGWNSTADDRRAHSCDRMTMSLVDITRRKVAEDALQRSIDELTRSNTELERFAYVASHDLREPLRSIVSYSQLLEHRYGSTLDGDAKEFLDFVIAGARRMDALVQDLLAYSRVGASTAEFVPVLLDDCLASALDNLAQAIQDSAAEIETSALPAVRGNPVQLTELFQNLLSNALKYHRPGIPPTIVVAAERHDDMWHVTVRDNGIGIDMHFAEAVFEIFRRLHGAEYPGTGIGLAVCRRIVQCHGGRIWLESHPGAGTIVNVMLPVDDRAAAPETRAETMEAKSV